ncbi:MAG: hypothetical protein ACOVQG_02590 [Crocinitomicaceae bacterium]
MMKNWLFLLGLFISNSAYNQIIFHQDHRIEEYVTQKKLRLIPGYRVQICFDPEKSKVEEVRNRFISSYPKIDTYMSFEAPYFNLKVGDFRTQIEAQSFAEKLQGLYTINIVHKEQINLPRVD